MTTTAEWTWLPHPAHFIGSNQCHFRLATVVGNGKWIVSTVGEYYPRGHGNDGTRKMERIGHNRTYETMVFHALALGLDNPCCTHEADVSGGELDMEGYNDPQTARLRHLELCHKWDKVEELHSDDNRT